MTAEDGSLKLERYGLRLTPDYQAVQVTAENAQQIAIWAGGSLNYTSGSLPASAAGAPGQAVVEIPAWREGTRFQSWILQVGDWVALDVPGGRFEVWPDAAFREHFSRTA